MAKRVCKLGYERWIEKREENYMKSTGIIRRPDSLGRIVIPRELFRTLDLKLPTDAEKGSPMEIFVDGNKIILRKYSRGCIFCENTNDTKLFKGKTICTKCIELMKG